jgi:hypothetical protein
MIAHRANVHSADAVHRPTWADSRRLAHTADRATGIAAELRWAHKHLSTGVPA